MGSIASLYIDRYDIRGNESEEKRVRAVVKKIHEDGSVFTDFPFDFMVEDEQLIFLHYIMTNLPERQILSNMKKVDADRSYMNFAYQSDISKKTTRIILEEALRDYSPIRLDEEYLKSRFIIRDSEKTTKHVLSYLLHTNELIIRSYSNEQGYFTVLGLTVSNFEYIGDYINYVVNVILQLLVYRTLKEDGVDTSVVIKALTDKVVEMDGLLTKQLERKKAAWITEKADGRSSLGAENVTNCFSAYITHRSAIYEEYGVKETLRQEMLENPTLFGKVPAKYEAEKSIMSDEEIQAKHNIITEGQHIDNFKNKLATAREFIDIMRIYGGRQCYSSCLQDVKVYFREIFISKSSYKRRMAARIVKEYIKQVESAQKDGVQPPDFDKPSQYMFVREKISRGYFREKGLASEYIEKINFEKALYYLLLRLYLFYDIEESLEFVYEVNRNLLKVYESLLPLA